MHILFVCRMLPYAQARDSGRLDTYHYIASLCQNHHVSLIAFVPPEDKFGLSGMRQLCDQVIDIPYQHNELIPRLKRAWMRLLQPKVYGRNHSRQYIRALRQITKNHQFDVAVVDGMMAEYGRFLSPIPTILDEVDLFSFVAYQLFRNESRWLSKIWVGFDWLRTMLRETSHMQDFSGIFVRSHKDFQLVRELAPNQQIAILPPWFEGLEKLMTISVKRPSSPILLFVGAMQIPANIMAVTFFAKQVLPLLQTHLSTIQFCIVGSQPSVEVCALSTYPGVTVIGDVPDLTPYYETASIVVVPLFTGGGIIVKTLNGLASGRPVVSTVVGNSGTNAQNGHHLRIVSSDPQTFSDTIIELLANEKEWYRFAESGRKFIQDQYDWSKTVSDMITFLEKVSEI